MVISLTSFLPNLVPDLGLTQAALYERQRALVRLGLLQKPTGRGRGSGSDATPHGIALVVLSVLATDNLSEMDERIAALARAPIDEWHKRKICRLTRKTTFVNALAEVIRHPELAQRVRSVEVERQGVYATIYWEQSISKKVELSRFNHYRSGERASIEVRAQLSGRALARIGARLKAEETQ